MSLGRAAGAVTVALILGVGVVGASIASAYEQGDDGDGKPSWKGKPSDYVRSPEADKIALDRIGDADRRIDIQSIAVFNRKDLDYVGLAIVGRDFNPPTKRSIKVYLGTGKDPVTPRYQLVAANDGRTQDAQGLRLYRVNGWSGGGKARVSCDKLRVQFDIEQQSQIRIAVPRSCIGGGRKGVGANVTVRDDTARGGQKSGSGRTDVVPSESKLTRRAH